MEGTFFPKRMLKGSRCNLLLLLFLTVTFSLLRVPFCLTRSSPLSPPLLFIPLCCSSLALTPLLGGDSGFLLGDLVACCASQCLLCYRTQDTVRSRVGEKRPV